jgi:hypothetical protein
VQLPEEATATWELYVPRSHSVQACVVASAKLPTGQGLQEVLPREAATKPASQGLQLALEEAAARGEKEPLAHSTQACVASSA